MKTPRLNIQLVLEIPVRAVDGAGGHDLTWATGGILWGEIGHGTGREVAGNGMPLSRVPLRIIVRAAPVGTAARPIAGQRFRHGTRIFDITAVTEHDPDGRYLICQTEERVAT